MKNYYYLEEMKNDILAYIEDNYSKEELEELMEDTDDFAEKLNDELWVEDSVTGNASGSYTFNRDQAKEYVVDNMDLLVDTCNEFDTDVGHALEQGYEYCDVTIRCGLLSQAIEAALDEIEDEIVNA